VDVQKFGLISMEMESRNLDVKDLTGRRVLFSGRETGETSNPASKHSTDQAALFANQEYKKVRFTEMEIKSNLERSYQPGE
jgi:acyl-homoserine lactone acylase PvdQ